MKLALASLIFAAPAAAFAPTGSFGVQNTALKMSTEAATEKVRSIVFLAFKEHEGHVLSNVWIAELTIQIARQIVESIETNITFTTT